MQRFRPLLIDRANIRVPGLQVTTFAVHRHLPEHASVEAHRHAWCQAIVYLTGEGEQTIGGGPGSRAGSLPRQARDAELVERANSAGLGRDSEVTRGFSPRPDGGAPKRRGLKHRATGSRAQAARIVPGSVVLLPPGVPHAFERHSSAAPQCVLVDFRLRGARAKQPVVCSLNRSEMAQLRQHVAHLMKLQAGAGSALRWEGAVPVLEVLLTVLRAAGWIERVTGPAAAKEDRGIGALLGTVSQTVSLAETIRRSGYQRDHLNRLVKKQTGLTLGQYRAQLRLVKAKELLGQGMQVAHVGDAVGLPDQGYFARWFRRQTGQTPSAWRRRRTEPV